MVKIIICGACGRMGSSILGLAEKDGDVSIAGLTEAKEHPMAGKTTCDGKYRIETELDKLISGADVVIDFTSPGSALEHLKAALGARKPAVIGTTGFKDADTEFIRKASEKIPVLLSPNMSAGVNLLFRLAGETAAIVPDYDIEIIEVHHNQKKDAPSGTAKKLAQVIAETLKRDLGKAGVYGREGMTGPRKPGEIGIHSVRAGDITGDHTVIFAGRGERIELTHRAQSRDTLASGALRAAKWIVTRKPGLYDMTDVLGL
jgi:4-hydroxy-tetrahydrodipicolinate reductase